ncbi:MAG: LPS assembly protein LptD, partial [Thermodesulfovibrionales bacterium]
MATGHVRIEEDDALLLADRAVFHQATSLAEAEGNVVYEDDETRAETDHAEMDLKKKTGRLHDAVIFVKKGHYWITGEGFEKMDGDHYKAKTASFTTCDSSPDSRPDWCFKGNDVDVVVSKKITARNVTYRIKGIPLLYSPYLAAPVKSERSTGLLVPLIGNSTEKGIRFSPAFFWAIDDNKDATLTLDYYSKRGTGIGAEYRYVAVDSKGQWYGYHLKDRALDKKFWILKGQQEYKAARWEAKADINYVNDGLYYKDYAEQNDARTQRFLQSFAEISLPLKNSRIALTGQYWVDMRDGNAGAPQK